MGGRSKSVLVYRVQDSEGRGPWRPGFSHKWVEDRPAEEMAALRPYFEEFPDLRFSQGVHVGCGCLSLRQLRRWFLQGEYWTLQEYGFQCIQIPVSRIIASSEIQCVFECDRPLRKFRTVVKLY